MPDTPAVLEPDPFTTNGADGPLAFPPENGADGSGADAVPIEAARVCPNGDGDREARLMRLSRIVCGNCSVESLRRPTLEEWISPKAIPFDLFRGLSDLVGLALLVLKNPPPCDSSETGDSVVALGVSSKSASSGMKLGMATPLTLLEAKNGALCVGWLPTV